MEKIGTRKSPFTDEDREDVYSTFLSNPTLSIREIAEETQINRGTVGRWLKEFKKTQRFKDHFSSFPASIEKDISKSLDSDIVTKPEIVTKKIERPPLPKPKKRENIEQIVDKVINYDAVVSHFELVGDKTMQVRMTKSSKPNREYRNIIGAIREMVLRELQESL